MGSRIHALFATSLVPSIGLLLGGCPSPDRDASTPPVPSVSVPLQAQARTERFTIRSRALGETRRVVVRLPPTRPGEVHPVLYVTDADWQFPVVAEYVEYLGYWRRIPPMIVVGIENLERDRDFIPARDPRFAGSGGAADFTTFLLGELRREIEARYPTSGFDVLFGHSFGGVLALHVLFDSPDAFDAYVCVGASTWVADHVTFDEARAFFDADASTDAMVFMSVAEADGGETVPAGDAFAQLWSTRAPESLEWSYQVVPRTSHFSAVVPSLHLALESLYPAWGFVPELEAGLASEGASAVHATFDRWRTRWGERFFPQVMELEELAFELAGRGELDAAQALARRLRKEAPRHAGAFAVSSFVALSAGKLESARDYIERALELADGDARAASSRAMYRALQERIETLRAEVVP